MTDPRYDPSFQRGYDGPPPELVTRPAPPARPAPDAQDQVVAAEQAGDGPIDGHSAPLESGPVAAEPNQDRAPRRRVNPYSLALLIGGLAATAVGAWMLQQLSTGLVQVDGTDTAALVRQALIQQLAPGLVVGGILALVAWLVLGALSAREKGRS